MNVGVAFRALGPIDLRSIRRDSILLWLIALPLVVGIGVRLGLPPLEDALLAEFGFEFAPYRELLVGFAFVLLAPMLVGFVTGFLLLDERDDNTLSAVLVTPVSLESYLVYRIGAPLLLCTLVSLVSISISGIETISWPKWMAVALLASLEAPLIALVLASVAENKVSGFALTKGFQAVLMVPIYAWFLELPWQLLAGVVPTYWPLRAYWSESASEAGFWIYLAIGFATHIGLLAWLLRRFDRVMHR
jgi:fluoroquinolone transport system permease protein